MITESQQRPSRMSLRGPSYLLTQHLQRGPRHLHCLTSFTGDSIIQPALEEINTTFFPKKWRKLGRNTFLNILLLQLRKSVNFLLFLFWHCLHQNVLAPQSSSTSDTHAGIYSTEHIHLLNKNQDSQLRTHSSYAAFQVWWPGIWSSGSLLFTHPRKVGKVNVCFGYSVAVTHGNPEST